MPAAKWMPQWSRRKRDTPRNSDDWSATTATKQWLAFLSFGDQGALWEKYLNSERQEPGAFKELCASKGYETLPRRPCRVPWVDYRTGHLQHPQQHMLLGSLEPCKARNQREAGISLQRCAGSKRIWVSRSIQAQHQSSTSSTPVKIFAPRVAVGALKTFLSDAWRRRPHASATGFASPWLFCTILQETDNWTTSAIG